MICAPPTETRRVKALAKLKAEPGIWMEEIPEPRVGPNDVLIKIRKTSICGTDVHLWSGTYDRDLDDIFKVKGARSKMASLAPLTLEVSANSLMNRSGQFFGALYSRRPVLSVAMDVLCGRDAKARTQTGRRPKARPVRIGLSRCSVFVPYQRDDVNVKEPYRLSANPLAVIPPPL